MTPPIERDDVLNAFAIEPLHDKATLERYLSQYPAYANDILGLAGELRRSYQQDDLSANDHALIERSWQAYSVAPIESVLSSLSVDRLRDVAKTLGVPRQVISAFREGRVVMATVPAKFLASFARLVGSTVDNLSGGGSLARSYKSDVKPEASEGIPFEQLLVDAGVSDERRAEIMSDRD